MSFVLGIDTSSTDLGIGIYHDGKPTVSYSRFIGNSHAEHITPALRLMLEANNIAPGSIGHIAIAVGPGSFTGLRIGIAFAKGYSVGCGALIMPVSSLFILAHAALPLSGTVIAAIDARNNDVYTAVFRSLDGTLQRVNDDTIVPKEQFYASVSCGDIIVTDTTGYAKSTVFSSLTQDHSVIAVERRPLHRGLICAAAGAAHINDRHAWVHSTDVHPNYLRRSTPEIRHQAEGPT
jgi:tRNA threonylcarbamoyladenosine biosynthesis protein TsaB